MRLFLFLRMIRFADDYNRTVYQTPILLAEIESHD